MTLSQLIAWHENEHRRLERTSVVPGDIDAQRESDERAAFHWDAINTLKWCVALPKPALPDQLALEYACETLGNECAALAGKLQLEDLVSLEDYGSEYTAFFAAMSANAFEQHPTARPARTDA